VKEGCERNGFCKAGIGFVGAALEYHPLEEAIPVAGWRVQMPLWRSGGSWEKAGVLGRLGDCAQDGWLGVCICEPGTGVTHV